MGGAPKGLGGTIFIAGKRIERGDFVSRRQFSSEIESAKFDSNTDSSLMLGVAMNGADIGKDVSVLIGVDPSFNSMRTHQDPYPFNDGSNDSSNDSSSGDPDYLFDGSYSDLDLIEEEDLSLNIIKLKPTAKATRKAIRER